MQRSFILYTLICLLLIACGSEQTNESETEDSSKMENTEDQVTPASPKANLLDGKWEATYVEGGSGTMEEMYPEGMPTITFDIAEKRVSGNSGCNNFTGNISVDGNTILWESELASTRKMCPKMDGEKAFLSALRKSNTYSVGDRGQILNLIYTDVTGSLGTITLSRVDE